MNTNRWKIFPYLIVLILSSCTSCNEPDPTELPAETQSGKNTFGCYVNNKIFLKGYLFGSTIGSSYVRSQKVAYIYCENKNSENIALRLDNFTLNKNVNILYASYSFNSDTLKLPDGSMTYRVNLCEGRNISTVTLTRFDTINHIISGKFEFELKDSRDTTRLIKITQGRFDFYLYVD